MKRLIALGLSLVSVAFIHAADIQVEQNPVPADAFAVVTLKLDKGDSVIWEVSPEPVLSKNYIDNGTATLHFNGPTTTKYVVSAFVVNFDTKKFARQKQIVTMGLAPKPPPIPPTPDPPGPIPPGPNPPGPVDPLKSFRIIFIYESADTLSPPQRAVIFGKVTEDYMNANCSGGKGGWRRRDKNAPGEADPTMSALWASVQPAITVTPCVAMERNGKVEIVNVEATPTKMVEVFQKYRGN